MNTIFFDSKAYNHTIPKMSKQYITALTACDWKLSTIEWLFWCLEKQTRLPERIVLLVYTQQTNEEFNEFVAAAHETYPVLKDSLDIVSSNNSSHTPWKFHGYDRQFLVGYCSSSVSKNLISDSSSRKVWGTKTLSGILWIGNQWENIEYLTLMLDIDNELETTFISTLLKEYNELSTNENNDILLAPTVMRRRSWRIQSQWIQWYSFLIPKYRFASFTKKESPQKVMMMGGNCLFGKTEVFQEIWFDPAFAYSYEDIDFTYRLTQSWMPLYVTATTVTYHMESQRSKLDQKLIWNPVSAYYRMKNYILFVKKNATIFQKIQALGFSIWGMYGWFVLNVLVYGGEQRWSLVKALSKWLRDGLRL